MPKRRNSIANALELRLFRIKPTIFTKIAITDTYTISYNKYVQIVDRMPYR